MEAEQRIQALEQEVQILKNQIQSILLDIQTHLLTNAYPALRGHHTPGSASSDDEDQDDDEYDRAAPAPKVNKVTSHNVPAKQQKVRPPVSPAEPIMASLDEQKDWVLQNIQNGGISRTRDLISEYTQKRRFTPEVSDTLMRFTDMYAAAADEPTLPSRPAGMPKIVKAVTAPPARPPTHTHVPPKPAASVPVQQPVRHSPIPQPVKAAPKAAVIKPKPASPDRAEAPIKAAKITEANTGEEAEASSLVLRLIAGVQNAGAGVRWGKTKN